MESLLSETPADAPLGFCGVWRPLCSSRKNPYPPPGRSLEIPRGRGILKVKILEAKYEAKLEFPGGRGVQTLHGGMWIFFWTCTMNRVTQAITCRQSHLIPKSN